MVVGDEFQQRAVRITEVDAHAGSACAETFDRTTFDRDLAAPEMCNRLADRPLPFKAQVGIAGLHREPRDLDGREARSMQIELRVAEAVGKAARSRNQLRAQHLAIEPVRPLPVGHMDNAVVELDRQWHVFTPGAAAQAVPHAGSAVNGVHTRMAGGRPAIPTTSLPLANEFELKMSSQTPEGRSGTQLA